MFVVFSLSIQLQLTLHKGGTLRWPWLVHTYCHVPHLGCTTEPMLASMMTLIHLPVWSKHSASNKKCIMWTWIPPLKRIVALLCEAKYHRFSTINKFGNSMCDSRYYYLSRKYFPVFFNKNQVDDVWPFLKIFCLYRPIARGMNY